MKDDILKNLKAEIQRLWDEEGLVIEGILIDWSDHSNLDKRDYQIHHIRMTARSNP